MEQNKKNIDYIKQYLREYSKTSKVAKSISFDEGESSNAPDYLLDCIMRCDGFYATVCYTQSYKNSLKLTIAFSGCDYAFSTFDILNVIEADDYDTYNFTDCEDEISIEFALKKITEFIDTYGYDITRIVPSGKLSRLKKLYEEDRKVIFGPFWLSDNEYKENDEYRIVSGSFDTKKNKEKLIKKLEGMDSLTHFDQRKLDYLKNNDYLQDDEKQDPNQVLKSIRKKVYIPVVISFSIVAIILEIALRLVIFGDAFVINDVDERLLGGISEFIFPYVCFVGAFAILGILLVGKPIVYYLSPKSTKTFIKEKLFKKPNLVSCIIEAVVVLCIAAVCMVSPLSNVGFGEDKIIDFERIKTYTYSYDEIKIYRVMGRYNSQGIIEAFPDDEVYYYLGIPDYFSNYIPMVYENDEDDKKLKEILSAHNVEIIEIEVYEDLEALYNH